MKSPSKMTNNELYMALKQAKIDVKNQGTARAALNEKFKKEKCKFIGRMKELTSQRHRNDEKINNQAVEIFQLKAVIEERNKTIEIRNDSNKFLNERNVKLREKIRKLDIEIKSTGKTAMWHEKECEKRDQIIKELTDKLTAADQQCKDLASMNASSYSGRVAELADKVERMEFQLKCADSDYANKEKDLQTKIKCLKDELAWYQGKGYDFTVVSDNTSSDLDYSYIDKLGGAHMGTVELKDNEPVIIPVDRYAESKCVPSGHNKEISYQNAIIEKLNSEIEHLKSLATVADYASLESDYAKLSRLFIQQSIEPKIDPVQDEIDAGKLEYEMCAQSVPLDKKI